MTPSAWIMLVATWVIIAYFTIHFFRKVLDKK